MWLCVWLCLTLIVSTCCCCCWCYFCCSALRQSYLSDTLHSFAIGSRFLSYQATLKCLAQILDSWFLSSLHWECRRQADSLCCGYNTMKALGCSFLGFFVHGCVCVCGNKNALCYHYHRQATVLALSRKTTKQLNSSTVWVMCNVLHWVNLLARASFSNTHTHTQCR